MKKSTYNLGFKGLMLALVFVFGTSCEPETNFNSLEKTKEEVRIEFINSATTLFENYATEESNSSLRTSGRDLKVDLLIDDLAASIYDEDFQYTPIEEDLWYDQTDDAYLGLSNEKEYGVEDLSPQVQAHLVHFQKEVEEIITAYDQGMISEEKGYELLKSACNDEASLSVNDNSLTTDEKEALNESFVMMGELSTPISDYLSSYDMLDGAAEGRFLRKALRALARVAVAVVVTAVIVAVPVAAVVAAKVVVKTGVVAAGLKAGAAAAKKAVLKSSIIKAGKTKFKVSAPLVSGLAAGMKNAEKNWDKPWKGIEEFTFGYKVKF